MLMLTVTQLVLLTLACLATTAMLVLGVIVAFPRSRHLVPARVTCPLWGGPVAAQLVRDDWTRRFTAVTRCEPLGGGARPACNQGCLANASAVPLAGAA